MGSPLSDLHVLTLDCQAGGATPAYGDLLELGWARCNASALLGPVHSHWIARRTERPISRAVRELTGWSPACLTDALGEADAWSLLCADVAALRAGALPAPTVIHYARFELPFLRDLHERLGPEGAFPFDVVDLHAIAARLFPDLPRRNIRALAGFLGHTPELMRRCAGHVEASVFIWQALVPLLSEHGVSSWSDLQSWLASAPKAVKRKRRVFPLPAEQRKSLPDAPGVYRFLRRNGDVLYVGKATSLKKRVASHFASGGRATERGLEMLSQVHALRVTETPSILEAALLETDEIKRIDPPYNVQFRGGERCAWFATRDLTDVVSAPDDTHPIGPLPSQRALSALAALVPLAAGAEVSDRLRAMALAVPIAALPEPALFEQGYQVFADTHLKRGETSPARRVACASRALWLARGRSEAEAAQLDAGADEAPPPVWDLARVLRRLERNLVQTGLLMRRARWLSLLADADIAYSERDMPHARALLVARGEVIEGRDLLTVSALHTIPTRRAGTRRARQACFDAPTYDRLRVLATELRRVLDDGGEVAVRVSRHWFSGERLHALTRAI